MAWLVAVVYLIRDWDKNFEKAQSRKVKGPMDWVALPTKHDGKSYRRIMLLDDSHEIYGAWVLIVQVAAKCPVKGVLADEDGPYDSADLAIKTGGKQVVFDKALTILSSSQIGWLVVADWERVSSTVSLYDRTGQDRTGQDRKSAADAAIVANPPQTVPPDKPAGPQPSLPLPPGLSSEPFPAAWSDWLDYRKERRLTLRDRTIRAQLDALAPLGPVAAAECVRLSIRSGWQGIFPERCRGPASRSGAGQNHDPEASKKDPNHGRM